MPRKGQTASPVNCAEILYKVHQVQVIILWKTHAHAVTHKPVIQTCAKELSTDARGLFQCHYISKHSTHEGDILWNIKSQMQRMLGK